MAFEVDYDKTRQQLKHVGEFATGKTDGSPTGTDIDETTLTYTGQVRKTVPKIIKDAEDVFDSQLAQQQTDFETQLSAQETAAQDSLDNFESQQASAIAAAGYNVVGNFTDGATLTQLGDAIHYAGTDPDNSDFSYAGFYAWTGTFPKVVSAGSSPITENGWQLAATGYAKQSGAIQLFGQVIDQDFNIPVGQNALSINAETADGVTVTIPAGSTYITIGDIQ